jgi:hypothetical protein
MQSLWWTFSGWLVISKLVWAVSAAGSNITSKVEQENGVTFSNVYRLEVKDDFAEVEKNESEVVAYFCHTGMESTLPRFWSSASFNLVIGNSDYSVCISFIAFCCQ